MEGLLYSFDSVVGGLDADGRARASELLRGSAEACPEAGRAARLLQAAEAVASGGAAGAAAKIPAAARGVTQEVWEEQYAPTFPPPPEAGALEDEADEGEEYEEEDLEVEGDQDEEQDGDEEEAV